MPRQREEHGDQPSPGPSSDAGRCAWYSSGKQCWLPGSMSPDIGDRRRQYCHWHYVALTHPTFATEFEEFERWNARWAAHCSLENHYPLERVWQAIIGIAPLSGEPTRCRSASCRYYMAREGKKGGRAAQQQTREVAA